MEYNKGIKWEIYIKIEMVDSIQVEIYIYMYIRKESVDSLNNKLKPIK